MKSLPVFQCRDQFLSPDQKHEFLFQYVTEYRFGDQLGHASLIDRGNASTIWRYAEKDLIREINFEPWSPDSRTVYFSTVADGNKMYGLDCPDAKQHLILHTGSARIELDSIRAFLLQWACLYYRSVRRTD